MSHWRQEAELDEKNKRITELEQTSQVLQLENENQGRRIQELEAWIGCLTESTLVATGGNERDAD